jgi:E3 SUMO-protein ligase PIAS1
MNEVDSCSTLVSSMRVPQLQAVLQTFDPQRSSGRKQELTQRIYNLLRDKKTQANTCQRIREITRTPALNPQQLMRTPFNQYQRAPHPSYYPAQARSNLPSSFSNAFMPGQMSAGVNVPVVMPARAGGRAEKMQITRLPFYDVAGVVLKMSELQPLTGRTGDVRCVFPFVIQPEHIALITYRGDQPTPRYELQLRMFLFDMDIEQADDFPPNCVIKVDDNPVVLPAVIPTNKPNAEQKRYSRPVDITQYIQSQRHNMNRTHKLEIDWFSDRRTWAVGIWLVHRQNADILLGRMLSNGIRRSIDETKKRITLMLDGDDDTIALDQLKISLLCPLMKTRMNIPARTKTCSHLQCFDLLNYLNMNEKRPSWKCPQCNANAHFDNLIVDQYFMDLLKAVEQNVEEVELLRDGNWKILEVACDTLSDDDDDTPLKAMKIEDASSKAKAAKKEEAAEIITLDDSDDEGARAFPASVSTNPSSVNTSPPRTPAETNGTSKSRSSPHAKRGKTDDSSSRSSYRRSRSSSSSSQSSSDSGRQRRRKVAAASKTNGKSNSSKKVNESEIIVIDSDSDSPAAPIAQSSSRSRTSTFTPQGSVDSNPPQLPMVNGNNSSSTNGNDEPPQKRPNGVRSDVARSQFLNLTNRLPEAIEYDVADGLTQFVNSIFLRDSRNANAFTAS